MGASFHRSVPLQCMARPLRLEVPGAIHHVMARANAGSRLFRDDIDRGLFLSEYAATLRRHGWFSLSYCLMTSHYHALVETPRTNLSRGMRDLNSNFARAWHARRGTHGHVFGGRFFSRLVERDDHLLWVARYIARNPVVSGKCRAPSEWRWSSHGALCRDEP